MILNRGDSCPVPNSCPDTSGTLPPCAGLAVPYVPFQQTGSEKYNQTDALSNGTLFPALNLPFHLKVEGGALPDTPMTELQALDFVLMELGHYLDTHPDDAEAFELFQQYSTLLSSVSSAYESRFGPLTRNRTATMGSFRWLQDPWPWDYSQNEVK